MYPDSELQHELVKVLGIPPSIDGKAFYKSLCEKISLMITTDFSRLVQLLYRLDINEEKLKSLLQHKPNEDAAVLIADLIIERQLQKIKSRKENNRRGDISDEDAW
jgi:hypothetical protein